MNPNINEIAKEIYQKYDGRKIVLWGDFTDNYQIRDILKVKYNLSIAFLIDTKSEKINTKTVLSPDEISNRAKDFFLGIPLNHHDSIAKWLNDNGYGINDYSYINMKWSGIAQDNAKYAEDNLLVWKGAVAKEYFKVAPVYVGREDYFAGNLLVRDLLYVNELYPHNREKEIQKYNLDKKDYKWLIDSEKEGILARNPGCHFIPDYEGVLTEEKSLTKRLADLDKKIKEYPNNKNYLAMYYALEGVILRIEKYAEVAEKIGNKRVAETCKKISKSVPESLYEAVQLIIILQECIIREVACGSISYGRIDKYLYSFYKSDIDNGKITEDDAKQIFVEFWRKIAALKKSWQNVTIGGEYNELTHYALNATRVVASDQPQLSLRVNDRMTNEYWEDAFLTIKKGMGFPSLFNDEVCIQAKVNTGIDRKDAENYAVMGCVELLAPGKEYAHTEGARVNLGKLFTKYLLTLEKSETYENFYKGFLVYVEDYLDKLCDFLESTIDYYTEYYGTPLASCFIEGCIEKGEDCTSNGAKYNNLTICFVGTATIANSLEALEEIIFRKKEKTLDEIKTILAENYNNEEVFRNRLENLPKFGNDIDSVDKKCTDFVEHINTYVVNKKHKYGHFQTGYYSSYFHSEMGQKTEATPDGRKAYTALSSALSPMAGTDCKGPLEVCASSNKIKMMQFGNGTALDLKFLPSFFEKQENKNALKQLTKTYFNQGGMELQFNVVDKETLLAAQKEPEKYAHLIVRVAGFSAYFNSLDKDLQDEIIARTAYGE